MKESYVYIVSNKNRTTLYIGVTSNLTNRVNSHFEGKGSEFTKRYNLTDLLYYEEFDDIRDAIAREKQLKNWKREWKFNLIKKMNPDLKNLTFDI
jgi:putative endonuclease